jgi:hypothetical protein
VRRARLVADIQAIHAHSRGVYGAPLVTAELGSVSAG